MRKEVIADEPRFEVHSTLKSFDNGDFPDSPYGPDKQESNIAAYPQEATAAKTLPERIKAIGNKVGIKTAATLASLALAGGLAAGYNIGKNSEEQATSQTYSGEAVPGQQDKNDETEAFSYEMTDDESDRPNTTARTNALKIIQDAREADDFKDGKPELYTYTDENGDRITVSATKEARPGRYSTGSRISVFHSRSTNSETSEKKETTIVFDTRNEVDNMETTLATDTDLELTYVGYDKTDANNKITESKFTRFNHGIVNAYEYDDSMTEDGHTAKDRKAILTRDGVKDRLNEIAEFKG